MADDTRFVYGATCAWIGPIQAVGNTKTHPRHQALMKAANAPQKIADASLPCCPHCGGMLFELPSRDDYMRGVPDFDKQHPGYAKFVAWWEEKCKTTCARNLPEAIALYNKETGSDFKV